MRPATWADIQRERARQVRARQQAYREYQQAQAQAAREAAQAERDRRRQAAADEHERRQLYFEDRTAEAAAMAEGARARLAELDGLLKAGLRDRPLVTFASLRRTDNYPAFDAGRLAAPPARPLWEHFAPEPPSGRGKLFGGADRFERELEAARADYAQALDRYTAAENGRQQQLAAQRAAHNAAAAAFAAAVAEHNAGVDQFLQDCRAGDQEAVALFCTLVLDSSMYPEGFPHQSRTLYRPDRREVVVEWELPPHSVIPPERDYQYVFTRDAIEALPRAQQETEELYRTVIAQVALRTIQEILIATPGGVIELVTFYGKVCTTDPAAGQPAQSLLLAVSAERELFGTVLSGLDPVACLGRLGALVSPHPCDLEPVAPTVDFEYLLTRFRCVAGAPGLGCPAQPAQDMTER
jgi:restriction system protein